MSEMNDNIEVFKLLDTDENKDAMNNYIDNLEEKKKQRQKDIDAELYRKAEIDFIQNHKETFTKTPALQLYYDTTPKFDNILTLISKLRYEVDRLNDKEYNECLDCLQNQVTMISLAIKGQVIEDQPK